MSDEQVNRDLELVTLGVLLQKVEEPEDGGECGKEHVTREHRMRLKAIIEKIDDIQREN